MLWCEVLEEILVLSLIPVAFRSELAIFVTRKALLNVTK